MRPHEASERGLIRAQEVLRLSWKEKPGVGGRINAVYVSIFDEKLRRVRLPEKGIPVDRRSQILFYGFPA
jgi:hypothetical protein